ncbi:MAG: hypothetical protein AAFU72_10285 [Pseudomonadota bacterium]
MSDYNAALIAKKALAARLGRRAGVNGVGVDVIGAGSFGVRVNLSPGAPPETLAEIPEAEHGVKVRTRVVGPLRTE